jgi:molecular chaperone DnaK (HSP70)
MNDPAVAAMKQEVEFDIVAGSEDGVAFQVDDMTISPRQVGSYVVNHLIQITKEFMGHDNVKSAVLAVPAKFDALQRQRTMEAFKAAGVTIARVLEEPAAAALAYGLHKKDGVEKILVYDFGGGTLDVSILHVAEGYCEVIGSDGDDRLGGADFDAAVAAVLTKKHSSVLETLSSYPVDGEELSAICSNVSETMPICSVSSFHTLGEQLKIGLSESGTMAHAQCLALPPTSEVLNADVPTAICDQLIVTDLSLSMEEFNDASKSLFERSILPVTRLLNDLTLNKEEIDEIVMVGGTTRMPQIRGMVSDAFSTAQMNTHIDPDLTVAYGAASVND